jgi:hypothetical protein
MNNIQIKKLEITNVIQNTVIYAQEALGRGKQIIRVLITVIFHVSCR